MEVVTFNVLITKIWLLMSWLWTTKMSLWLESWWVIPAQMEREKMDFLLMKIFCQNLSILHFIRNLIVTPKCLTALLISFYVLDTVKMMLNNSRISHQMRLNNNKMYLNHSKVFWKTSTVVNFLVTSKIHNKSKSIWYQ